MARIAQRTVLTLAASFSALAALGFLLLGDAAMPVLTMSPGDAAAETVAAAAAAAAPTATRTDAVQRRGCWTAPAGASFRYEVADRTTIQITQPRSAPQAPGIIDMRSLVTTTVIDRRAEEALIEARIDGLRFLGPDGREIAGDAIQQSYVTAAATPTLLRIDGRGRIEGFGFAQQLDGDQRNFLRGVVGLLFVEAPVDGATTWTSAGSDSMGGFEASYEALPGSDDDSLLVRRTRLALTSVRGMAQLPSHSVQGGTQARFALARGWLAGVEVSETLTMELPLADMKAHTARKASATLVAEAAVAVAGPAAWDRANASATGEGERMGGYADAAQRREWRERLQGVALADVLAEIERLLAAAKVDDEAVDAAFQKLQWLLRGDDVATRSLAEQLLAGQVASKATGVAIGALGAAGTVAAQDALLALRDDRVAPPMREQATTACLQLAEPGARLLQSLADEARSESGLRSNSLLVLGALAGRAGSPNEGGPSPLANLLAMEAGFAARGELDAWVFAVGNSGAPQALDVALRLLGHEQAAVRIACCAVLRRCPGAQAFEALTRRGLADADPMVRMEALAALARRSEASVRAFLETTATLDLDAAVRAHANELLAAG